MGWGASAILFLMPLRFALQINICYDAATVNKCWPERQPEMAQPAGLHDPVQCRIQVVGEVDDTCVDYLGGLSVMLCDIGSYKTTVLTGQVTNQAGLIGVLTNLLTNLLDFGFPLYSVDCWRDQTPQSHIPTS